MPANINDAFNTSIDYNKKNKTKKNKTIKMKQNQKNQKVENFLSSLRQSFSDSEDENENDIPTKMLPFPQVQSQKTEQPIQKQTYTSNVIDEDDNSVSKEEFTNYLDPNGSPTIQKNTIENFKHSSGNHWIPYFTETNNGTNGEIVQPSQQKELMNKLNYLIHMIESEKSEKTGHVTEELILYSFLGVFMIFIVDSFTKVSKYSR